MKNLGVIQENIDGERATHIVSIPRQNDLKVPLPLLFPKEKKLETNKRHTHCIRYTSTGAHCQSDRLIEVKTMQINPLGPWKR